MNHEHESKNKRRGRWISTIALAIVHLLAFGMLYLVVVQMNWAFVDFFKLVGAKPTPKFETISVFSDFVAAYTPIVLLVIALDILVIVQLSRRASRWTSAYSHAVLLGMGFIGFLWTAWAVDTMAWGALAPASTKQLSCPIQRWSASPRWLIPPCGKRRSGFSFFVTRRVILEVAISVEPSERKSQPDTSARHESRSGFPR